MFGSNLFRRYLLSYLLAFMLPFAVIVGMAGFWISREAGRQFLQDQSMTLDFAARNLDESLYSAVIRASYVRQRLRHPVRLRNTDDTLALAEALGSFTVGNDSFSGLYYVDLPSRSFCFPGAAYELNTFREHYSFEPSLLFDESNLRAAWIPFTDRSDGSRRMALRVPVFFTHASGGASTRAVLLYLFKARDLLRPFDSLLAGDNVELAVSSGGSPLFTSRQTGEKTLLTAISDIRGDEPLRLGEETFLPLPSSYRGRMITARAYIREAAVWDKTFGSVRFMIDISLLSLGAGFIVLWFTTKRIFKPIRSLGEYVNSLGYAPNPAEDDASKAPRDEFARTRQALTSLERERSTLATDVRRARGENFLLNLFVSGELFAAGRVSEPEPDERLFILLTDDFDNEPDAAACRETLARYLPEQGFGRGRALLCRAPVRGKLLMVFRGSEEEFRLFKEGFPGRTFPPAVKCRSFAELPAGFQHLLYDVEEPDQVAADRTLAPFSELRRALLYDDTTAYIRTAREISGLIRQAEHEREAAFLYALFLHESIESLSRKSVDLQPRLRRLMLKYARAENSNRFHYQLAARAFVSELLSVLGRSEDEDGRPVIQREALLDYLQKNVLSENFSQKTMAAHFGVSESHLSHCYKDIFGMTLSETVMNMRLAEARRLLIETSDPVSRVAAQVGYGDASSFSRAFRRQEGMSPLQYRKERQRSS